MATNTFGPHNGAGRIAPATIDLGIDGEGRHHIWRRSTNAVHVIADGERVHVARLGARSVDDWMVFIADELCGWRDRRYGLDFGDMLRRALE